MSRSDVESLYTYTHCGIDVSKVTDIYIQQENHKLLRAFAMATNAPLEPGVYVFWSTYSCVSTEMT